MRASGEEGEDAARHQAGDEHPAGGDHVHQEPDRRVAMRLAQVPHRRVAGQVGKAKGGTEAGLRLGDLEHEDDVSLPIGGEAFLTGKTCRSRDSQR